MAKKLTDIPGKIAKKLSHFCADTFVLYVKTLNFHWNMRGPNFFAFHRLLEEQYKNLAEATDDLAERIRMLGYFAPSSCKEFLELTHLKESHSKLSQEEMVLELAADHATLETDLQKLISFTDENLDQGSSDLLAERIRFHSKSSWLLRTHLEK